MTSLEAIIHRGAEKKNLAQAQQLSKVILADKNP